MNPNRMGLMEKNLYDQLSPKELATEHISAYLRTMNQRRVNRLIEDGGYTLDRTDLNNALEALCSDIPYGAMGVVESLAGIEFVRYRQRIDPSAEFSPPLQDHKLDTRLSDLLQALKGNPNYSKFLK